MYMALDAKGEQITASLIDPQNDLDPVISVEITNLIKLTNTAWLYPSAARELAHAILARCDEADRQVAAGQDLARRGMASPPAVCRSCGFAPHDTPGCPRWPAIEDDQDIAAHDEAREFAAELMASRGWSQS